MIDVAREKLMTKEEAAQFCGVSVETIDRWMEKGVQRTGKRLESLLLGGSVRTSIEAIARFSVQREQADSPRAKSVNTRAHQAQEQIRHMKPKCKT